MTMPPQVRRGDRAAIAVSRSGRKDRTSPRSSAALVQLRIELSVAVRVGDAAERLHLLHDLAHGKVPIAPAMKCRERSKPVGRGLRPRRNAKPTNLRCEIDADCPECDPYQTVSCRNISSPKKKSPAEARFTSPIGNCYTTHCSQECARQHCAYSVCCTGNLLGGCFKTVID